MNADTPVGADLSGQFVKVHDNDRGAFHMSFLLLARLVPSVVLQPGDLLAWLIVGLIAGFFASALVRGRGYGCLLNIVIGLVGAVIGGYLASLLDIGGIYHFWGSVVIAFFGSCILVAVLQLFSGGRSRH